jgi:hypothetical protein
MRRSLPFLGTAAALAALALPLAAADQRGESSGAEKSRARIAAVEAKLTPTQKSAVAEFRAKNDRQIESLQASPSTGAAIRKYRAGDGLQQVAVAKRGADGKLEISCVENASEFAEFLVAPKSSKPERKEQ